MARYIGPVCRLCRREGTKLFLKGERCSSDKCSFERRSYAPGVHGQGKRGKLSEYGSQLREKQKVRRAYGMLEKQFRNLFQEAYRLKGVTSQVFFKHLELRLDNVVYRMGFARSRNEARQIVRHNHILVNGKRLNIPSARMKVGDEISIDPKSQKMTFLELARDFYSRQATQPWFSIDAPKHSGKIIAEPTRDDIQMAVKDRLIVELYSK